MNQPGNAPELLEVQTLNLKSMLETLFNEGDEKNVDRFRVSDCQPLWVEPVNTGRFPLGAPLTSISV